MLIASAGRVLAGSTVTSNFSGTPIEAGKKVWYSSVVRVGGHPTYPLTIYLTHQRISSPAFVHSVPNAILILDPAVTVATTIFNGVAWVTTARPNERGYYFLSGYADSLVESLPGSVSPVSWTGDFTASRPGVSVQWQTAAAVYSSFNPNLNSLGIKPSDCGSCSFYQTAHKAGTPEKYTARVVAGALGEGVSNYTGNFSEPLNVTPALANDNTYVCEGSTIAIDPVSTSRNWSSSSPAVATVSSDGSVTGVKAGTARISYMLTGYPVWQSLTVTVSALPTLTAIARPGDAIYTGNTLILNVATTAIDGVSKDAFVSWTGPDGFTSSLVRPTRPELTPSMDGIYHVTITDHGCTASAQTLPVVFSKLADATTTNLLAMPTPRASFMNSTIMPSPGNNLLWPKGFGGDDDIVVIKSASAPTSNIFEVSVAGNLRAAPQTVLVYKMPAKQPEKPNTNVVLFAGSLMADEPVATTPHLANYSYTRMIERPKALASYDSIHAKKKHVVDPNLVLLGGTITPYDEESQDVKYTDEINSAVASVVNGALGIGDIIIRKVAVTTTPDKTLYTFDELMSVNKAPATASVKGRSDETLLTFDDIMSVGKSSAPTTSEPRNETLLTFDELMSVNKAPVTALVEKDETLLTFSDLLPLSNTKATENTLNATVEGTLSRSGGVVIRGRSVAINDLKVARGLADADVFADDNDDRFMAVLAAIEDMDENTNSPPYTDTGPLYTRHTNAGIVYIHSTGKLSAYSGDAARPAWTSARSNRSMMRNPRAGPTLSGIYALAVSSLSSDGSPPMAHKAIGTAHSPPAMGTAHSPPAILTAHSPPAIGVAHAPPAIRNAHSPPAIGSTHLHLAVCMAHLHAVTGTAHSPPATAAG